MPPLVDLARSPWPMPPTPKLSSQRRSSASQGWLGVAQGQETRGNGGETCRPARCTAQWAEGQRAGTGSRARGAENLCEDLGNLARWCGVSVCAPARRRVQLVRRDGRDVSTLYGREGGGGATLPRGGSRRAHTRPPSTHLHHTPGTPERSARKVPSAPAEPSFPGSESTWNSSPWSARGRAEGRSFDCSSTRGAGGQTGRGRVL
jgi:hypothetical protein